MIKCAYKNILESSTVTLSAGTEDSSYPLWRIYDRDIGRIFKTTAAETIEIKIDQGADLFADGFNDNSIDPAKWNEADSASNINETNQRIEGKGNGSWNANGLVTDNSIALAGGLTWCFTLEPQHGGSNPGMFGPATNAVLAATPANNCYVRLGVGLSLDVSVNGSITETGYHYQSGKTYHCRIVYKNPGWEVWVVSPDDANYASETLIFSTATDSAGPMHFHANFNSSAGLTCLDSVVVYNTAGFEAVNRLLIPEGHNLNGMDLSIQRSDNDADYASPAGAGDWEQSGTGLINKSWDSATHRYWKFFITSPSSIPQMPEMFLTQTYEWEKDPARPAGPFEEVFNVEASQTAGGADRFLVRGGPKRQRLYHMPRCGEAQKDNIMALFSGWGGSKPFWLEDHEGDWIYGRLKGPLDLKELAFQAYSFDFDFLEVLG